MHLCPEFPCDNERLAVSTEAQPVLRLEREPGVSPRDVDVPTPSACETSAPVDPASVVEAPSPAPTASAWPLAERRARERDPNEAHDPFLHGLVEAMAQVAGDLGADVRALLQEGVAREGMRARLVDTALVGEDGALCPKIALELAAWRAIVRGELSSQDLRAWSGTMLDDWAAELLASILGQPALATSLRAALRGRGLCAFGLARAA